MGAKWTELCAWVKVRPKTLLATVLGVTVSVAVIFLIAHLVGVSAPSVLTSKAPSGGGIERPAEFLYLDATRVGSYLAQIDNGALEDEKVTNKVKASLKANLKAAEVIEAGASEEKEEGEEREVKPTEASRFLELRAALQEAGDLYHPLAKKGAPRAQPQEGEFVEFRRPQMFTPAYLKPYLTARRAEALRAALGTPNVQGVITRRKAKTLGSRERFLRRLGEEPRAVLRMMSPSQGVYLLPIEARLLSPERSLLKYGGGRFTVVGKVVRVFPEPGDEHKHHPAYEDSATREEWLPALKAAPGRLICRSAKMCASAQHAEPGRREPKRALAGARRRDLGTLRRGTAIGRKGAVILPVAIYK